VQKAAEPTWWGGTYSTAAGERVAIRASSSYPADEAFAQRWADYLGSLVHGSELSTVTLYIATPAEVQELCRERSVGCYGGNRIVAIGEASAGAEPEAVVAHEYGHHVAASRRNDPWPAVDWGPKRWSSAVGVCARVAAGMAFPGDEGLHYTLNPGEAFAETYRVLTETGTNVAPQLWQLADLSFLPTPASLAAVEQDVLHPWLASTKRTVDGRFPARGGRTWTLPLATPLDGQLSVSVKLPAGRPYAVSLLGPDGAVRARGLWSSSNVQTLDFRICGERSLALRVQQRLGPGRFRVTVVQP
jgi:hypothetical protein